MLFPSRFLVIGFSIALTNLPVWANEPHGEHKVPHPHPAPAPHVRSAPVPHVRPPARVNVQNQSRIIVAPTTHDGPMRTEQSHNQINRERTEEYRANENHQPKIVEPSHYHFVRRYFPPRGYRYRVWVVGEVLPRSFWARRYWLPDYWQYGLDEPAYGYEWVRYGPDALLVNLRTGQVVEVVSAIFQ